MNLLDKIKLIIEARSFYVNKRFFLDIDFCILGSTPGKEKWHLESVKDWLNHNYDMKIRKLLQYEKDESKFGWIIWYI